MTDPPKLLLFPALTPRTRPVSYAIIFWSLTRSLSFSAPSRRILLFNSNFGLLGESAVIIVPNQKPTPISRTVVHS